jgi:hypothetical protein
METVRINTEYYLLNQDINHVQNQLFTQAYRRAAIWWTHQMALSAIRLETGLADSHVYVTYVACCCFCGESPYDSFRCYSTGMHSNGHKLATARFNVWSSNAELTTAPHFSTQAGAYYVTRRRGQVSLNRDHATVHMVAAIPRNPQPTQRYNVDITHEANSSFVSLNWF